MKRYRYKNILLISLIVLSQIHTLFRGVDFDIHWILNGIHKRPSHTVFLFVKHFSELVLLYCMFRPKGVSKDLVLFLFIVVFFDVIHFITLSGFGYGMVKIIAGFLVFSFIKSKYFKWRL